MVYRNEQRLKRLKLCIKATTSSLLIQTYISDAMNRAMNLLRNVFMSIELIILSERISSRYLNRHNVSKNKTLKRNIKFHLGKNFTFISQRAILLQRITFPGSNPRGLKINITHYKVTSSNHILKSAYLKSNYLINYIT